MPTPTLEEKLTQLQLMSAPAFLAAWEARHPAERAAVREVLAALVDRELTRRSEQKVAARIKAARFVQLQTADTFNFDYSAATRKLRSRYLNLLATDLVAEGIGVLFVGGSGLVRIPAHSGRRFRSMPATSGADRSDAG
jgi:DNA replication protein DnaC